MVEGLLEKLERVIKLTRQNEYLSEVVILNFNEIEIAMLATVFSDVDKNFNMNETEIASRIIQFLIERDYETPIPEGVAIKIINQLMIDITIASMVKKGLVKIVDIDENNQWTVALTEAGQELGKTIN